MNWYKKSQILYGYHGTDPTKIQDIKKNGLKIQSFFSSNEDDISPYADGIWLRFPFPKNYEKRIGRGDYYTSNEIILPETIEIKTNIWENYKKL